MKVGEINASQFVAGVKFCVVSFDGGKTWTHRWLTQADIEWHRGRGYIVKEV